MSGNLAVVDVTVKFGGVCALDSFSHDFAGGGVHGIIGPNGAGKTTLFNTLTRLVNPASGHASFGPIDLLQLRAHDVVRNGIARTFQNLGHFPSLTIRENVLLGAHADFFPKRRANFALRAGRARQADLEQRVDELMGLLELADCGDAFPGSLPFGTLKRLELARALAANPRLLFLDEPANGLSRAEVSALVTTIRRIRERFDLTIVLVEHHMGFISQLCDQVVAIVSGRKVAAGTAHEVQNNQRVIEAYLGTK